MHIAGVVVTVAHQAAVAAAAVAAQGADPGPEAVVGHTVAVELGAAVATVEAVLMPQEEQGI